MLADNTWAIYLDMATGTSVPPLTLVDCDYSKVWWGPMHSKMHTQWFTVELLHNGDFCVPLEPIIIASTPFIFQWCINFKYCTFHTITPYGSTLFSLVIATKGMNKISKCIKIVKVQLEIPSPWYIVHQAKDNVSTQHERTSRNWAFSCVDF